MDNRRNRPEASEDLSLERLQDLLDTYGAASDRWPAEDRDSALALIANSTEARAAMRVASALDRALDGIPAPQPSGALSRRLAALDPAAVRRTAPAWRLAPFDVVRAFRVGRPAAMAASALAGLVVGFLLGAQVGVAPPPDVPANLAILEDGGLAPEPFGLEQEDAWTDEGVLALALH